MVRWLSLEELTLPTRPNSELQASIPREEIRHTRAVQDWLAEGRQEGDATTAGIPGSPPEAARVPG